MAQHRYGLRYAPSKMPSAVEVTVPEIVSLSPLTLRHHPIKRFYGFTPAHAWKRAVKWTRAHGDPR